MTAKKVEILGEQVDEEKLEGEAMTAKKVEILGEQVDEEKLKGILKDVLKVRGVSGEITLNIKEGRSPKPSDSAFYKYSFFDCLGSN